MVRRSPSPKSAKWLLNQDLVCHWKMVYDPQQSTSNDQQMFNEDASTDAESQEVNDNSESESVHVECDEEISPSVELGRKKRYGRSILYIYANNIGIGVMRIGI